MIEIPLHIPRFKYGDTVWYLTMAGIRQGIIIGSFLNADNEFRYDAVPSDITIPPGKTVKDYKSTKSPNVCYASLDELLLELKIKAIDRYKIDTSTKTTLQGPTHDI